MLGLTTLAGLLRLWMLVGWSCSLFPLMSFFAGPAGTSSGMLRVE